MLHEAKSFSFTNVRPCSCLSNTEISGEAGPGEALVRCISLLCGHTTCLEFWSSQGVRRYQCDGHARHDPRTQECRPEQPAACVQEHIVIHTASPRP